MMLKKLGEQKSRLTLEAVSEMRSYNVPNSVIQTVIQAVLRLIRPGVTELGTDRDVSINFFN